jgi:hypothetical protein
MAMLFDNLSEKLFRVGAHFVQRKPYKAGQNEFATNGISQTDGF